MINQICHWLTKVELFCSNDISESYSKIFIIDYVMIKIL